jgi:cytochrome c556
MQVKIMKRIPLVLSSCALMLLTLPVLAADQDVIQFREAVMKTLNEQSAALGEIAAGAIPDDNLVTHMDEMALAASTALKAFTPKVPGGDAKPEVWANWADFSKKMSDFAKQTADGAKIAKEQGKDAAMVQLINYADSCKGCHDMYRQKKKNNG